MIPLKEKLLKQIDNDTIHVCRYEIPPPYIEIDGDNKYDVSKYAKDEIPPELIIEHTSIKDNPSAEVKKFSINTYGTGGVYITIPAMTGDDAAGKNNMDIKCYNDTLPTAKLSYGTTYVPLAKLPMNIWFKTDLPYKAGSNYYKIRIMHELDIKIYREIAVRSCY